MNELSLTPRHAESGAAQELERRLALVGPRDTTRGFLFGTALEAVKRQTSAAALKRCVDVAGSHQFTAFFAYPISTLLKLTYAAARELRGLHGGFDGAMRHLGFHAAPRFLDSAAGRMMLSFVGRDPRRLFEGMPTAYRTAWEHGGCALAWTGLRRGRLQYTNALPAAYFVGSVQQMLMSAGLQGTVTSQQNHLTEFTVDFSWQ